MSVKQKVLQKNFELITNHQSQVKFSIMNKIRPISEIMVEDPITVSPNDPITIAFQTLRSKKIHHLPVMEGSKMVGMISESDLLYFLDGKNKDGSDNPESDAQVRMANTKVREIMTKGLAKLDHTDPIRTAISVFRINKFRALPVMKDDILVGIVTPIDLIAALDDEPVNLKDY